MTTSPIPSTEASLDIAATLYWELPQLDADELAGLTTMVHSEMTLRVGERLSGLCTDAELAEFGSLMDTQDDKVCASWLDEHIPSHREIAGSEIEDLLGETVAAVEGSERNDGAVSRPRRRRIEPADQTLLLRTLEFQQRRYSVDGDVAVVVLERETGLSIAVRLSMTRGGLFCARATYPIPVPEQWQPELIAFVHRWNRRTYFPKAYAVRAQAGAWHVVAESAMPLAAGVHGQLLDYVVVVCLGVTARLFEEFDDAAAEWQPPLW